MKIFPISNNKRTTLLSIIQQSDLSKTIELAAANFPDLSSQVKIAKDSLTDSGKLVNGSADIVLVEANLQDRRAMFAIKKLSQYVGVSGSLIVLSRNANASSVRDLFQLGVSDVLELPINETELSKAIASIIKSPKKLGVKASGRVISLLKSGGGAGATMLAVNIANNISSRQKVLSSVAPKTLVIDLDPQFGTVASVCGASGRVSILDLIKAGDEFDSSLVESVVRPVTDNMDVIASPSEILPLSSISSEFLKRLLTIAQANYDYVIMDHSQNWSSTTATALTMSDVILPVTLPCVEHANSTVAMLSSLTDMNIEREKVLVVHNRVKGMVHADRVNSIDKMTRRPSVTILEDTKVHIQARNLGKLLSDVGGSKGQRKAIAKLVDRVLEILNTPVFEPSMSAYGADGFEEKRKR